MSDHCKYKAAVKRRESQKYFKASYYIPTPESNGIPLNYQSNKMSSNEELVKMQEIALDLFNILFTMGWNNPIIEIREK